jgi:hypothetical protein
MHRHELALRRPCSWPYRATWTRTCTSLDDALPVPVDNEPTLGEEDYQIFCKSIVVNVFPLQRLAVRASPKEENPTDPADVSH